MIYCIDIDNTICYTPEHDGVREYKNSFPYGGRILMINRLYEEGHTIIYWTARGASTGIDWSELTKKQLDDWQCKYHELKMNKPSYDVWIDDKAIDIFKFFEEI